MYDCINFQRLLPTDLYAPGAVLPPHLSPFTREGEGDYIPPDKNTFLEGTASKDTETMEIINQENKEEDISDKDDEDKIQDQPPPKRRKMQVSCILLLVAMETSFISRVPVVFLWELLWLEEEKRVREKTRKKLKWKQRKRERNEN